MTGSQRGRPLGAVLRIGAGADLPLPLDDRAVGVARTAGGDVVNRCPLAGGAGTGAGSGAGGAAKPRMRIRVAPRRVRAGRRTRIRFRVTSRGRPVPGAKVRFAGRTKRTGRRGRAVMVRRFTSPGPRRAVARKRGKRTASVRVRVRVRVLRPRR